jgi:hypothetical protein
VRFVYAYASESVHQEAFKALLRMATNDATLQEFVTLNQLAGQLYARHASDLPLLKILSAKLGLPLQIPSVETIQRVLDYVGDPNHQQSAFMLGDIVSNLVIMGMQSSFTPLPSESLLALGDNPDDFFALSDKVRFEDVQAASYLSRVAFGFWTMSPANKCKALSLEELSTQDLRNTFSQIEQFLSAKEYGLKSWLSLLRRAAHDVNKPRN